MLKVGKKAEVITPKYGHYLAVTQLTLAVAVTVFLVLKKKLFAHSDANYYVSSG